MARTIVFICSVFLFFGCAAKAAERCLTFDNANWTVHQVNAFESVCVRLLWEAGEYQHSRVDKRRGLICADLPDGVVLSEILNESTLLAEYNELVAEQAAGTAAQEARLESIEQEQATNEFCNREIEDIESAIDAHYADATAVNAISKIKQAQKVMARCIWARTAE